MIQLAWRFLMFQKESALALWYRARTADSRIGTRKTMIVALARKLVIALWIIHGWPDLALFRA
jgi:transposase